MHLGTGNPPYCIVLSYILPQDQETFLLLLCCYYYTALHSTAKQLKAGQGIICACVVYKTLGI
jgi:hypothetical protein